MTRFTSRFVLIQFASSEIFLIVIVGVGFIINIDPTIQTAQLSQGLLTIVLIVTAIRSWGQLLPKRPAAHTLPDGHWLIFEGFKQNYRTMKQIHKYYKNLQWYLFAVAFAEAGSTAILSVAVTFLSGELGLDGIQVGIVFIIALTASLPGTWASAKLTSYTNPNTCLKLIMIGFMIITASGAFVLTKERKSLGYLWGFFWGFVMGAFYPAENLMFAILQPKGQEAELTGFFAYCNSIVVWLPPFIFSILVENGFEQRYGLVSMCLFQIITVGFLSLCDPWDVMVKETTRSGPKLCIHSNDDGDVCDSDKKSNTNKTQQTVDLTTAHTQAQVENQEEIPRGTNSTGPIDISSSTHTINNPNSSPSSSPRPSSDAQVSSASAFLMAGTIPPHSEDRSSSTFDEEIVSV